MQGNELHSVDSASLAGPSGQPESVVSPRSGTAPPPPKGFFRARRGRVDRPHGRASGNPQKVAESAPLVAQAPWNQAIAGARAGAKNVLLLTHMCGMITTKHD